MAFDDTTKAQVIIAASIIAGSGADEAAVTTEARKIISRISAGSAIAAEFERIATRDEATEKVKSFRATIIGIDKEMTSTRGVIFLKTAPSKWHPNGKEFIRTDRTDSIEGREIAKLAQSLVGHQVTVGVAVETTGEAKVRVVRSITDNGVDPEYDAANEAFQLDYDKLDVSKLASHRA